MSPFTIFLSFFLFLTDEEERKEELRLGESNWGKANEIFFIKNSECVIVIGYANFARTTVIYSYDRAQILFFNQVLLVIVINSPN